jgi:metal-responsive CopG/Arc/MetJ family transcriptional regulator
VATNKAKNPYFLVYDGGNLRTELKEACQALDMNRSQLVRHAIRRYLKEELNEGKKSA